jgi:hypothetical protein
MADASGAIFDWLYFAPDRPLFKYIAHWSDGAITVGLVLVAMLVFVAAFTFPPLFAWLVLP